jgi:hypothetical protein
MLKCVTFTVAAGAAVLVLPGSVTALADPKAVVELFTSQGCSSCPPADRFVAELSRRDDVVAVTLPVDYWDYLGWKDTLGRHEHTKRQYAYAEAHGNGKVFTPQIVVNGRESFVGGNREAVEAAIRAAELPLDIDIARNGEAIDITVEAMPTPAPRTTTVRLVTYDQAEDVTIERGENRGRTITYSNVVREMRPIGMWKGERLKISLPLAEIMTDEVDGCAVIVQEDGTGAPGAILGAAKLE